MTSRIKSFLSIAWSSFRAITRVSLEIVKFASIGYVIFVGIPQIYIITGIESRLDANIYDFYGIIILLFVSHRLLRLEKMVREIKKPERVYFSVEDDKIDDDDWFKVI
jgi:hypothetical protein